MTTPSAAPTFGSPDLRLPDALRGPLLEHLAHLRQQYLARNWAGRVGFGKRPALIVIDIDLGDVMPVDEVLAHMQKIGVGKDH